MRQETGDFFSSMVDWISGKTAKDYRAQMALARAQQAAAEAAVAQADATIKLAALKPDGAPKQPWINGVPNFAVLAGGVLISLIVLRRSS